MVLLLNVHDLQVKDFIQPLPPYAILSHRCGSDETSMKKFLSGEDSTSAGYQKILQFCSCVKSLQTSLTIGSGGCFNWVWVDACCLDRTSATSLTEVFNGFYRLYEKATVCCVYLDDVAPLDKGHEMALSSFRNTVWFTRAWTLQELVAPRLVLFYNVNWELIGPRADKALAEVVSAITGINTAFLTGARSVRDASVAERLSWSARRMVTRVEDQAYCLMGFFGVNMPLLYGEGTKAFKRLQEEIMKSSDDQSIFAWVDPCESDQHKCHDLLATSPSAFEKADQIMPYQSDEPSPPYMMTNKGLSIQLHLLRIKDDLYAAILNCPTPPDYTEFLGIYLKKLAVGKNVFARVHADKLLKTSERGTLQSIIIRLPKPGDFESQPQPQTQAAASPIGEHKHQSYVDDSADLEERYVGESKRSSSGLRSTLVRWATRSRLKAA